MATADILVNAFTTLLVTLDPPGLAPVFLGLTVGMSREQRRHVAVRGSLIAFGILAVFALFGASLLGSLGISMGAFRIAGGLLLFWISFEMVFERRQERKEKTSQAAVTADHLHNIAVFPLALPLIAGPGAISATVLLADCRTAGPLPGSDRAGHPDPPSRSYSRRTFRPVRGGRREVGVQHRLRLVSSVAHKATERRSERDVVVQIAGEATSATLSATLASTASA